MAFWSCVFVSFQTNTEIKRPIYTNKITVIHGFCYSYSHYLLPQTRARTHTATRGFSPAVMFIIPPEHREPSWIRSTTAVAASIWQLDSLYSCSSSHRFLSWMEAGSSAPNLLLINLEGAHKTQERSRYFVCLVCFFSLRGNYTLKIAKSSSKRE